MRTRSTAASSIEQKKSRLHRVYGVSTQVPKGEGRPIRESSWSVSSFFLQERPPKQAPDGVLAPMHAVTFFLVHRESRSRECGRRGPLINNKIKKTKQNLYHWWKGLGGFVYVHALPRVFMNDEKAVSEWARAHSKHRRFEYRTEKSRLHRVHGVSTCR